MIIYIFVSSKSIIFPKKLINCAGPMRGIRISVLEIGCQGMGKAKRRGETDGRWRERGKEVVVRVWELLILLGLDLIKGLKRRLKIVLMCRICIAKTEREYLAKFKNSQKDTRKILIVNLKGMIKVIDNFIFFTYPNLSYIRDVFKIYKNLQSNK